MYNIIDYFCILRGNNKKCLEKIVYKNSRSRVRFKHRHSSSSLKKSYEALGLKEDCEDEALRLAFVHLAKQYHPDSGFGTANATKFSEIENAYRSIQRQRNAEKERSFHLPDVEEFDIKHTAPQHRHFLAFDTGIGTPSERQKRFTAQRAEKAVDNLMEHRLKKIHADEKNTLVGMDKTKAKDIRTKYGIDRLVEDYIQDAMNRGEFSHLPGMGKPLEDRSSAQNPYVDFVTHKMNEILIDNGFTPEWIQLSKEIRNEIRDIEEHLADARAELGPIPFSSEDELSWQKVLKDSESAVKQVNMMIDKYNLLVPILQKQMVQITLGKLEGTALARAPSEKRKKLLHKPTNMDTSFNQETPGFFDLISSIFEKKKS